MTTKNAEHLAIGDQWRENRRLVQMTGSRPGPAPSWLIIEIEDIETNTRRELHLYRVNRREVI